MRDDDESPEAGDGLPPKRSVTGVFWSLFGSKKEETFGRFLPDKRSDPDPSSEQIMDAGKRLCFLATDTTGSDLNIV